MTSRVAIWRERVWQAFAGWVSHPPVTLFAMKVATRLDRPLLKLSGGRWRFSFIIPVMLLRCYGARSGELREVPLLYVPQDGEREILLIASNGGQTAAPAWYYNLKSGGEVACMVGASWATYTWQELEGDVRATAWLAATAAYPGYAAYQSRANRQIPIMQLTRVETAND